MVNTLYASGKRQKVESNPTTTPGRVLTPLQRTTLILGEPAISHVDGYTVLCKLNCLSNIVSKHTDMVAFGRQHVVISFPSAQKSDITVVTNLG